MKFDGKVHSVTVHHNYLNNDLKLPRCKIELPRHKLKLPKMKVIILQGHARYWSLTGDLLLVKGLFALRSNLESSQLKGRSPPCSHTA